MHRESRAIRKMCGIETELGVNKKGEMSVETSAASFIKNIRPEWLNAEFQTPAWDSRERLRKKDESDRAHDYLNNWRWKETYNHLLRNGARLYLDGAHPEISGPICADPHMLVVWNRACYRWIDLIRKKYQETSGEEYRLIRNNVGMTNQSRTAQNPQAVTRESHGCHLNMTVARFVNEHELIKKTLPWFILQLPMSCSGKVGADYGRPHADFQISQRADFMFEIASTETMYKRPWCNRRNRSYADAARFRCEHMIPFDSNMLELPEYLKAGLTAILLMMIEDGELDNRFEIQDPLNVALAISRDTDLRLKIQLVNREKSRLIVDCLRDYHDLFASYLEEYHPDNAILNDVVRRFDEALTLCAARDWPGLFGKLDWVTKKLFIEQALSRKQKTWTDWLAYRLDIDYHDNNHETGLFYKTIMRYPDVVRIATDAEIAEAMTIPPPTRARWIVETIRAYQPAVRYSDYYYCVTFNDATRNDMLSLFFPDPDTPWDDLTARELFTLPLNEFLVRIQEKGIARAETCPTRRMQNPENELPSVPIFTDAVTPQQSNDKSVETVTTIWDIIKNKFNKIM
ncbi:proteasome accessory factor PafA2 family protein [Patescibacteria group bacterium]|nr:proteasome accessory factor PafA2 family protein [Patescibacteria group bacterium]